MLPAYQTRYPECTRGCRAHGLVGGVAHAKVAAKIQLMEGDTVEPSQGRVHTPLADGPITSATFVDCKEETRMAETIIELSEAELDQVAGGFGSATSRFYSTATGTNATVRVSLTQITTATSSYQSVSSFSYAA